MRRLVCASQSRREHFSAFGESMTETPQQKTQRTDWELRRMTPEERRQVEISLSRLSPKQVAFVHDTLQRGRAKCRLPVHELNLLERCLETWWAHGLPTKMAVLASITSLSGSTSWLTIWTDDEPHKCPTGDGPQRGTVIGRVWVRPRSDGRAMPSTGSSIRRRTNSRSRRRSSTTRWAPIGHLRSFNYR